MSKFYNVIVAKHYHAVMQFGSRSGLTSGSKLFTWYDVCCNIGGGLCPSCKIQRGGGGFCPSCKIQQGGLCPSCKIHGGGFCPRIQKWAGGGFVRGGFCPTLLTKQCQYSGWSESRLFVHAAANSSLSSKLGSLPTHYVTVLFCENTDQTIIKCRFNAGSSHHLTLNLFVFSADKLYKFFFYQEIGLTFYWAWSGSTLFDTLWLTFETV